MWAICWVPAAFRIVGLKFQQRSARWEIQIQKRRRLDFIADGYLLDEIDDVLEENAEDFVRAYVQKGGQ